MLWDHTALHWTFHSFLISLDLQATDTQHIYFPLSMDLPSATVYYLEDERNIMKQYTLKSWFYETRSGQQNLEKPKDIYLNDQESCIDPLLTVTPSVSTTSKLVWKWWLSMSITANLRALCIVVQYWLINIFDLWMHSLRNLLTVFRFLKLLLRLYFCNVKA